MRTASIRGFYRFAFGDGLIATDVAAHIDLPRQLRLLPTRSRSRRWTACSRRRAAARLQSGRRLPTGIALRNRALALELLYAAGLRISEALGLDLRGRVAAGGRCA